MGESAGSGEAVFVGAGALGRHLAGQLTAALARPEAAATRDALAAAGEIWREIGPRNTLEKLLAVQMIAGHEAALDGYARARALPEVAPESDRARRAELRLAARSAAREHKEARKAAAAEAAAPPKGGGVLVVPRTESPEAEARRMAETLRARRRAEKAWREGKGPPPPRGPDPNDPYAAAAAEARAAGRGCLIVPGKLSQEEWTRAARIYQQALMEEE